MNLTADDDAARDVVRVGHDRCLQVRAGAGTGKTRELVGRIVELVAAGTAEIGELAVITFTEKAAAELRDRVRAALEARAATGPEPERARAAAALDDLDTATICTLHAFARRILTEHPYAGGVTPGFEVLDEVSEQAARAAWWRQTLARMHDDPDLERPLVTLAAGAAVRAGMLEDVARVLEDRQEHLATVTQQALPAVPPLEDGPLLRQVRHICALRASCATPGDALAAHLERLERWVDECTADDEVTRLRLLAGRAVCARPNAGTTAAWPDGLKQQIVERLEAAEADRTAALDRVLVPAAQAVVIWLARAVRDAAADRVAQGRLTFHDLLVTAAGALRADGALRARCAERWRHVLIDEFQDTDPLQLELAVRIAAADPAAAGGPWQAVPLRPGALFVVGDPQQSIYRFRRADIAVYAAARRHLPAHELHLQRNHRSRPGILDWVNTVFGALLTPGGDAHHGEDPGTAAGVVQVAHQPLRAAVPADPAVPIPVRVLGGPLGAARGAGRVPAAAVRAQTAEDLAALACRIVVEGWPVRTDDDPGARADGAGGPVRPARFGDVAILLPSRLMLRPLESAFERAGLSLRVECQSLLWATREVDELTQVLRAIADPADRLAIVASLRTPAFGCSDRDLAAYRLAGGRWSPWADPPEALGAGHPVTRGLARLRDLARRVAPLPVDEAVEAVVDTLRLLQLAACTPRPRDAWRRLRHVTAAARCFAADAGVTLRDFVAWIELQADSGARVDEAVVAEPDDDAVRVFTIHGAKGLEFPIVALAGLASSRRPEPPRVLVSDAGVEVQLGYAPGNPRGRHRVRTAGYAQAAEAETKALAAEELRLWYVAATRARDHLVVACHHTTAPGAKNPSFAARLWQLAQHLEVPWAPIGPAADLAGTPAIVADPADRPVEAGVAERDAWWAARQAVVAPRAVRPVCSATKLGAADEPTPLPATVGPDPDDPETRPWRRGRAATARGRAVHAVLQSIDLATGDGLRAAAHAQAEAEAIPGEAARIAALADGARAAPTVQALITGRCWREVPLAVTVDGVLVEGYVDLLAEAADGSLVVVDFKTDGGIGRTVPAERLAPYRRQLAAYALALQAVTGRTVSRAVLVFARAEEPAVELEIDDLPAAIAEVRTLLADRFAAPGAAGVGPAGLEPATHGL